jgi:hypothetical protein
MSTVFLTGRLQILFTADSDWDRAQWKFGRLFDQNYEDLIAWVKVDDSSQVHAVW